MSANLWVGTLGTTNRARLELSFLLAVAFASTSQHAHSDGTLDPNFGIGGVATIDFSVNNDDAYGLAVQADGKIVVVGTTDPQGADPQDFALARLMPNGVLDSTFGTGGKRTFTLTPGSADIARSVAVDANGRIIVAGISDAAGTIDFAVARLLGDGTLDSSFGTNGVAILDLPGVEITRQVVALPTGSVLVVGFSQATTGGNCIVAKLTAAGALDASFGPGGRAFVDFGTTTDTCEGVAVDSQARIVVAGGTGLSTIDVGVARLTVNGLPDGTFGATGIVISNLGGDERARAVGIHPNDSIVVGGERVVGSGDRDFLFARYLAGGSLDPSFGAGGWATLDFGGTGRQDDLVALIVQPDGKLLGVGTSSTGPTEWGLARMTANGLPDNTWGTAGWVLSAFGGGAMGHAVAIPGAGRVLAAGFVPASGPPDVNDFGIGQYVAVVPIELISFGVE